MPKTFGTFCYMKRYFFQKKLELKFLESEPGHESRFVEQQQRAKRKNASDLDRLAD